MTSESRARGEKVMECTRCGRCMDICPNGAIEYRLIGTEIGVRPIFVVLRTPKQIVYPTYTLKSRTVGLEIRGIEVFVHEYNLQSCVVSTHINKNSTETENKKNLQNNISKELKKY